MTVLILIAAIFLLGFVADPIINLYLDPWSFFMPWTWWSFDPSYYANVQESSTWTEHFAKGLAGMGVVGCMKVIAASPFNYFRLGGGGRRRGRTTGRDRAEQVGWLVILIGVMTVMTVSCLCPKLQDAD